MSKTVCLYLYDYSKPELIVCSNVLIRDKAIQNYVNGDADCLMVQMSDDPADPNYFLYEQFKRRCMWISAEEGEIMSGGYDSVWLMERDDVKASLIFIKEESKRVQSLLSMADKIECGLIYLSEIKKVIGTDDDR